MPQILISPEDISENSFVIKGKEAHHLIRVLRKKVSDEVQLFDGKGTQFMGKLTAIDTKANEVRGTITKKSAQKSSKTIILYQGLPQGSKFDFVIEKATELGVGVIAPFLSKKNPVRLSSSQASAKVSRWNRVAKAAAKQCGRPDVPVIEAPCDVKSLEPLFKNNLSLFLWENEKNQDLKKVLRVAGEAYSTINLIIGPESGFTDAEAAMIESFGAFPVSLGKRILRTETAGLVALSILNYELGLF